MNRDLTCRTFFRVALAQESEDLARIKYVCIFSFCLSSPRSSKALFAGVLIIGLKGNRSNVKQAKRKRIYKLKCYASGRVTEENRGDRISGMHFTRNDRIENEIESVNASFPGSRKSISRRVMRAAP